MPKKIRLAIDFDGTLVEHKYPDLGREVPGAFRWLKEFKDAGAILALWTMRSDASDYGRNAPALKQAVEFCFAHGIEFDFVNLDEDQKFWTHSPKLLASYYIDDRAIGCPLWTPAGFKSPVVDWDKVGPIVMEILRKAAA